MLYTPPRYGCSRRNPRDPSTIKKVPQAKRYILDAGEISFIRPYGVIALLTIVRQLALQSKFPLELKNLQDQIHSYLHRVDFFNISQEWLSTTEPLKNSWLRNPHTHNLLEVTTIIGADEVTNIASRAHSIFSEWLTVTNLNQLISVISELCSNIYQHSGDQYGNIFIQKYESETQGQVWVHLAVGDLGCGIRGSLVKQHNDLGQKPISYLLAAMSGRTSRSSGRGGLGLRRVDQIVKEQDGCLWLRSETAALFRTSSSYVVQKESLPYVPGTQIAINFRAPLRT